MASPFLGSASSLLGLLRLWLAVTVIKAQVVFRSPPNDTWKFDLSECGTKKGCWFMPGDCYSGSNGSYTQCHSIFTWRLSPKGGRKRALVLEFDTRTDDMQNKYLGKYASVGFSDDHKMGDDYVIECVANPAGHMRAFVSFNDHVTNIRSKRASELLLSNTRGSFRDGRMTCQTTYAIDDATTAEIPDDEKWRIVDITSRPFYLMFVRGDASLETDTLQMHWLLDGDQFPWLTTERTDVTKDSNRLTSAKHYDIPRTIQYQLTQAHGIMMVFGWWLFAASAMLLSRYFKPMWPDTKLCGQSVWFQLHRALMITSLTLQCSAFALIFIQAGTIFTCSHICDEGTYALMLHTYLGVACTAATLIQPFMALCRPSPLSPKRPIFNWLHWFFGTGAFIIATVTIFLSAILGKAGLRRHWGHQPDYIMAGYVVVFIICSLAFEMVWYSQFRAQTSGIKLSTTGPRAPVSSDYGSSSFSGIQVGILGFFVIAATALCAALSYFIGNIHH